MARQPTQNVQLITQGAVTLKVYKVSRTGRAIFSVAHKENGRRQLKQFSDQVTALNWAVNRAKEIDRGHAKGKEIIKAFQGLLHDAWPPAFRK